MPVYSRASDKPIEEVVNIEDEDDDDYDDRAPRQSKTRSSRPSRRDRPPQRKRRKGYKGSDVDSDSQEVMSDDASPSISEISEEEIETNERGRPVRKSAKKAIRYEESDIEDESTSEDELDRTPRKRSKKLIVKLKTGRTPVSAPNFNRSLRNRSGSYGIKQLATTTTSAQLTRRSSRLSHDEEEPVVALSNSGRHIEVVRAGSRDPENTDRRPLKGGKGIKYPSKSTIDEESESARTRLAAEDEEAGELEIQASQHDMPESEHPSYATERHSLPQIIADMQQAAAAAEDDFSATAAPNDDQLQTEAQHEDDDEDDAPVRRGRLTRGSSKRKAESPPAEAQETTKRQRGRGLRVPATATAKSSSRRRGQEESSDFDPQAEAEQEDDVSSSSESETSRRKPNQLLDEYESSNNGRRSTRLRSKAVSRQRSLDTEEEEDLAVEVEELTKDQKKSRPSRSQIVYEPRGTRRAAGKKPDYNLLRNLMPIEDEEDDAPAPSQRTRKPGAGSWQRSLFNTYGPFGGGGGLPPILGGPVMPRAQGDVDSDSSDDDATRQPRPLGGMTGMTPTAGVGATPFPQSLNADPFQAQAAAGTPANLGKIKDRQALADADPLGVDQNVNFDSVGGLQGHIDQLKEMVALPLLYPEIFLQFKLTPPRGVLFHGPPGTGKTLLARALATSVSSQGKKVTFYMRKGADALSKWVGEAERQLRLLFEEARKTQPSIIFFDEIDGLAPVRSSKQEQIHASIVSTLLALMDGMDGRGQVIVIGATNRPDSIDPALRRPGRFDREFYFPLPNTEARRHILDIHTRGWNPPLESTVKDELAELTKGYGGADLRALCTEAALNAVQRRYPQIYKSNQKLLINPKAIEVTPKDFMISIKKMVPSSERATSSGASPLPQMIIPLLQKPLDRITELLAEIMPQRKRLTALQEAEFEDVADGRGFGKERMQQAFETSRVFRPRLLVRGKFGMGQQYLAAALLNHFEGFHVQSFDLPTLLSDTASTPEATVVRLFTEVKMHKPSVIYIPNVQDWYAINSTAAVSTFLGLLRSIKPTDPILFLGVIENDEVDENMIRELFGYSKRNQYQLEPPDLSERSEFFAPIKDYVRTAPDEFPEPEKRKKRILETLIPAPPEPEKPPTPQTKEERKAQIKRDRHTLNLLKIQLQPIMDQIRMKHKKFRTGVIEENQIRYLYDDIDPGTVTSDLPTDILARASFRPFEIGHDPHGEPGLIDQANDKFYYNLDTVTIEKRLSNGFYKRPKDFLTDIRRLAKDAKTIGDEDRLLKANELLANVEVDIAGIELGQAVFAAECERVYQRELIREKELAVKQKEAAEADKPPATAAPQISSDIPQGSNGTSTNATEGPITLGIPMPRDRDLAGRTAPITPSRPGSDTTLLTNGFHSSHSGHREGNLTNGSGHDADNEGDTAMEGMESNPTSHEKSHETTKTSSSSFGNRESAQVRPFHSYTAPSLNLKKASGMSEPLSQTGALTPMARGSQAADYRNDASTTQTSSGKRNSGPSSGERVQGNTQESGPNLYLTSERRSDGDGSEIPDTQDDPRPSQNSVDLHSNAASSQPLRNPHSPVHGPSFGHRSPPPPVPTFDGSSSQTHAASAPAAIAPIQRAASNPNIVNLLNPPESFHRTQTPSTQQADSTPNLIQAEEHRVTNLHQDVSYKTSGLSIEQLEQVNSYLMDTLWRTRGEWDRGKVVQTVVQAFNDVMDDMKEVGQEFGQSSWGRDD